MALMSECPSSCASSVSAAINAQADAGYPVRAAPAKRHTGNSTTAELE